MNREPATLIILAGGESRRMGTPKHLLSTPQGRIIDRLRASLGPLFVETLVVGREIPDMGEGLRAVEDLYPLRSPLVGIYSGLQAASTDVTLVVACDMPLVRKGLVAHLLSRASGVDVVVPVVRGYYEPLCAVYRRSVLAEIRGALDRGELKVASVYERLRVREMGEHRVRAVDPELSSFVNLNTKRDLEHHLRTDNGVTKGVRLAAR